MKALFGRASTRPDAWRPRALPPTKLGAAYPSYADCAVPQRVADASRVRRAERPVTVATERNQIAAKEARRGRGRWPVSTWCSPGQVRVLCGPRWPEVRSCRDATTRRSSRWWIETQRLTRTGEPARSTHRLVLRVRPRDTIGDPTQRMSRWPTRSGRRRQVAFLDARNLYALGRARALQHPLRGRTGAGSGSVRERPGGRGQATLASRGIPSDPPLLPPPGGIESR